MTLPNPGMNLINSRPIACAKKPPAIALTTPPACYGVNVCPYNFPKRLTIDTCTAVSTGMVAKGKGTAAKVAAAIAKASM